jgi:pilus assembly protein Flp/PilA
MKRILSGKKGQGMTEYILIIALIAIAVIGAVKLFGGKISSAFSNSAAKVDSSVNEGIAGNTGSSGLPAVIPGGK